MFYITPAVFPSDNYCSVSILACCCSNAPFLPRRSLPFCEAVAYFHCNCVSASTPACSIFMSIGTGGIFTPHISLCVCVCVCACLLIRGDKWELTSSAQPRAGFKNIANCQEMLRACTLDMQPHTRAHAHNYILHILLPLCVLCEYFPVIQSRSSIKPVCGNK